MDSHFAISQVSNDDFSTGSLSDVPHSTQPCLKNGDIIPAAAITELKDTVKGSMVVQGQASASEYLAAIDRWNQNGIKEAVCHPSTSNIEAIISIFWFRQLLSSVNQRMMFQFVSAGPKNGALMLLLRVVVTHSMELHRLTDLWLVRTIWY